MADERYAIPDDPDARLEALRAMLGNNEEAWAALRMIRETLEELGRVDEAEGVEFADEATALVKAIGRLAAATR